MRHPFYDQLTTLIGHRGACGHSPENTIASFEQAKSMGMKWVEADVVITSDHIPIIFHDETLDRCTDSKGLVLKTAYSKIKTLDAGSWYSKKFSNERIPTLKQLIETCIRLDLCLNLEIKCPLGAELETVEAITPIIHAYWPKDKPLILSSFRPEALSAAMLMLPDFPRGLNVNVIPKNWQTQLERYQCGSLHFHLPYFDLYKLQAIKLAGYKVLCFTINDPSEGRYLIDQGVDGVFTDYPMYLDAALKYPSSNPAYASV